MKRIYSITLFLLWTGACFSQEKGSHFFHMDTLQDQAVLLERGWKFHAGDNPKWAMPDFEDNDWENINPTLDLHYLPQIGKESVGWFRIKFRVDSSLLNKSLSLRIYQSIASEIYQNGKLLVAFGAIKAGEKEKTTAYRPDHSPIGVIFQNPEQTIAVRFAVQQGLPLTGSTHPFYAFRLRILQTKQALDFQEIGNKYPLSNALWAGIYVTLAIIHLGIFLSFKNRKADLYFSFALLSGTLANIFYIVLGKGGQNLNFISYGFVVDFILLIPVYNFFLYLAICRLFALKRNILHWGIILLMIAGIIAFIYSYEYGQMIMLYTGFAPTIILSIVLAWNAFKKGKKEAIIIAIGFSLYLIINTVFIFIYGGYINDVVLGWFGEFALTDLLYFLGVISIPFSLSLFLARDFASTSSKLQSKLQEVQILSDKTINQEKEKQEILSSQKAMLEQQVGERTAELKQSLEDLKSAQAQLIQSEKMASLGELTAGIAHEIQNPLNFVNNFSEVNTELIAEMKDEIEKGNIAEVSALANDIAENEEKIHHHGKRADAIVKGMLQHSRSSSGVKEPTDINALADEYLRLAYHGLRAKDKSFNATVKTDFDETIGNINIIPQDIGRILLNLINNAFFAVTEKKGNSPTDYEPTVIVSSKLLKPPSGGLGVVISVSDNGNGIPQKVLEKIFQPFFTTKPTGQGTGLGLSLSYDIVKVHGGELKVETREGEGSTFIVNLPVS